MTVSVQTPFLQTSQKFTQDPVELEPVLSKTYTQTATAVNARTIGLYETVQVSIGDRYFSSGDPQNRRQAFRKVFSFGAIAAGATLTIPHLITGVTQFVNTYGECITATPDFRRIPWASATLVTDQIQATLTTVNIIIVNGATAPAIVSGIYVCEYLLN